MNKETQTELQNKAKIARAAILTMTTLAGSGHPGGSLSSIDLLLTLYSMIKHDPKNPILEDRDRVIVSNGHVSPAVYACLGLYGYFRLDDAIAQFRKAGSIFEGHIEREVPGVEWTTGNLGQGLSAGAGMALACRLKDRSNHVFVLMGDGEQQKGQITEARRFAMKYNLNNLTAIVDYNRLQISGSIHKVMPQNIRHNWESDGWKVIEVNGHDLGSIFTAFSDAFQATTPTMILAHTIMGKGIPFMENQARYHGSTLSEEQLEEAMKILELPNKLDEYKRMRDDFLAVPNKINGFSLRTSFDPGAAFVYDKETDNRSAWGAAIADLAKLNKDKEIPIVVVDCDLQASVKTAEFEKETPERFIQAGIMEQNAAVVSGALSTCGIQTFWADFGMFGISEVYNNQRLNDINHTNLKVIVTHVGIDVGEDGRTHQCIDYIGLMRNLYGFRVIIPAEPNQTDRVIRWLVNQPGNFLVAMGRSKLPFIRRDNRELFYGAEYCFEYGKIDIIREGKDGTVIVTGTPIGRALKAVDMLREEGLFLKLAYVSCPLDISGVELQPLLTNAKVITVEDHNVHTGLGSIIAEKILESRMDCALLKIGIDKYPVSGSSDDLYKWAGMDPSSLKNRFRSFIQQQ